MHAPRWTSRRIARSSAVRITLSFAIILISFVHSYTLYCIYKMPRPHAPATPVPVL
jgi:hypothetical protein